MIYCYATGLEVIHSQFGQGDWFACRCTVALGGVIYSAATAYCHARPWEHEITRTILENRLQMMAIRAIAEEKA